MGLCSNSSSLEISIACTWPPREQFGAPFGADFASDSTRGLELPRATLCRAARVEERYNERFFAARFPPQLLDMGLKPSSAAILRLEESSGISTWGGGAQGEGEFFRPAPSTRRGLYAQRWHEMCQRLRLNLFQFHRIFHL